MAKNLIFLELLDSQKYLSGSQESHWLMLNQILMAEELFHVQSFEVWWGSLHLGYNSLFLAWQTIGSKFTVHANSSGQI